MYKCGYNCPASNLLARIALEEYEKMLMKGPGCGGIVVRKIEKKPQKQSDIYWRVRSKQKKEDIKERKKKEKLKPLLKKLDKEYFENLTQYAVNPRTGRFLRSQVINPATGRRDKILAIKSRVIPKPQRINPGIKEISERIRKFRL